MTITHVQANKDLSAHKLQEIAKMTEDKMLTAICPATDVIRSIRP